MQDLLKQIEHHYQQLCSATSTFDRVYNGKAILSIMETYPELTQYWMYLPHEFLWQDRFVRVGDYQPTPEVPVFYDDRTNLKLAPKLQGLYFYGNTAFNPETNEVQFWVKIGVSTNLYNRAKAYCTCNPSTYVIGYKTIADTSCYRQEHEYHQLLSRIALFQNQNSEEWWMVDRETYLAMCEKSFDFLLKPLDKLQKVCYTMYVIKRNEREVNPMIKKIYFDMDGTIANLYAVEGWLPMLRAYDPTPYAQAVPMVNMSRLARYLHKAQRMGIEVGIISWLSKEPTEEYDRAVTLAKLEWLQSHLPSVKWDEIHIVAHGTPKTSFATCEGCVLFDDEVGNREEWGELAYTPEQIFDVLMGVL